MDKQSHYAVVGGPDGRRAAVRCVIDAVRPEAAKFECDLPFSQADAWTADVRAAAETLAKCSIGRRGQSDSYQQTGVLKVNDEKVWRAFATFASYAYDASVWDASDRLILSLADEGSSCVLADEQAIIGRIQVQGIELKPLH